MAFLAEAGNTLGSWLRPHTAQFALALVATLLVIYGEDINALIRRHTRKHPFILRLLIFVLICAFGYGLLTVAFTELLSRLMGKLDRRLLAPALAGTFLLVGFLAERKKQL